MQQETVSSEDVVRVWLSKAEDQAFRVYRKRKGHKSELVASSTSHEIAQGIRRLVRLREGLHPDTLDPWDSSYQDAVKRVEDLKRVRRLNRKLEVTRSHQPKREDASLSEWAVDLLAKRGAA